MGFIHLASSVLFDAIEEEGQLLSTTTGTCVDLDPLAALFLQTALSSETKEQALAVLVSRIDAPREQLEESFQSVLEHLLTLRFLSATASSDAGAVEVVATASCAADERHPAHLPQLSRHDRVDWEFFSTGRLVNGVLPHVSLVRRGWALWKTATILLIVGYFHSLASVGDLLHRHSSAQQIRQHEWKVISESLSRLRSLQNTAEADHLARLARRELVVCQMLVRVLAPTSVCLVRSIALCAYLRALGLPATVVIGRPRFDLSGAYPFHAWTELAGLIVNDDAEVQSGYTSIQRLPFDERSERGGASPPPLP